MRATAARQLNFGVAMQNPNSTPEAQKPPLNEGQDPRSGENDDPKAITGAVEAGWNGSVAGTNDALEPDAEKTNQ